MELDGLPFWAPSSDMEDVSGLPLATSPNDDIHEQEIKRKMAFAYQIGKRKH